MMLHSHFSQKELLQKIKSGELVYAGNSRLKIYGLLNCSSGKRMHKQNRMFFIDEKEAIAHGYRPCGHCMPTQYKIWKEKSLTQK